MPFNPDAVRKRRQELSSGNSFTPKEGETVLFFCDSSRPEDMSNYVELQVHYGLGPRRIPGMCLDTQRNPAMSDPRIIALAQEMKGFDLKAEGGKGCPVCNLVWGGAGSENMTKEQLDDIKASRRFVFAVVPIKYKIPNGKDFQDLDPQVLNWNCSYTQWERIADELAEIGNPCDPKRAVFLKVKRVGTKKNDTKYTIEVDKQSLISPVALPKPTTFLIQQSIEPGAKADIYMAAVDLARTHDELIALMTGIQVDQSKPEENKQKPCHGQGYDAKDTDCQSCDESKGCAEACGSKTPAGATTTASANNTPTTQATAPDPELEALERELEKRKAAAAARQKV